MKHLGSTPPFRGPEGALIPNSIAEVRYLRLGGIDQWVMIRGEDVANPPLIYLHGGPGLNLSRLLRHHNGALERSFTVVCWDQRGAGKSFDPKLPRSSMTVEQFIADLDELVEFVRKRLGKEKVVLFGHSWGAGLGVLYAQRFPHKVSAYVGAGQPGDWAAGEAASYAIALRMAEERNDRAILDKLREIGPPPHDARAMWVERTALQEMDGALKPRELWKMGRIFLEGPEFSVLEFPSLMRAFKWSLEVLWPEVSRLNLVEQVPELKVPVFFFLGRKDHWVPPEASVAYFDVLRAPSKKLLFFENAGHEVNSDEPEKFNAAMVELVRPVVVAQQLAAPSA